MVLREQPGALLPARHLELVNGASSGGIERHGQGAASPLREGHQHHRGAGALEDLTGHRAARRVGRVWPADGEQIRGDRLDRGQDLVGWDPDAELRRASGAPVQ